MYNKISIISGLAVFVLFVTLPVWFNAFSTASTVPKVELPPGGEKECVAPAAEMRANHMKLLNEWRDDVLRTGERVSVTVDGKEYRKGLQMACMECHSNYDQFCNTCHVYASVQVYCWDCHLTPDVAASKKEAQ